MGILSIARTKETFRDKISSQTVGSQEYIFVAIDNFEKFSMERYNRMFFVITTLSLKISCDFYQS